jgi:hypothetical protein
MDLLDDQDIREMLAIIDDERTRDAMRRGVTSISRGVLTSTGDLLLPSGNNNNPP